MYSDLTERPVNGAQLLKGISAGVVAVASTDLAHAAETIMRDDDLCYMSAADLFDHLRDLRAEALLLTIGLDLSRPRWNWHEPHLYRAETTMQIIHDAHASCMNDRRNRD
jgi:hypothetical protein